MPDSNTVMMANLTGEPMDDRVLVRRMVAGEERAFDVFFNRYFPPLYRFATARLDGDADSAEDAVQMALTKAMMKIHTFRGEAALMTWLHTFCRREISRLAQRKQRIKVVEVVEDVAAVMVVQAEEETKVSSHLSTQ